MKLISIYILYETGTTSIRYVGKTSKILKTRLREHLKSSQLGKCHKSNWIRSANYNISIKLLARVPEEFWEDCEKYYIQIIKDFGYKLTNITDGGNGAGSGEFNPMYGVSLSGEANGMFGKKHTIETRNLISKNHCRPTGAKNGMFGRKRPQELKDHLSKLNKGKTLSPEIVDKIKVATKGNRNPFYGRNHTTETKKLLAENKYKKVEKLDPNTDEVLVEFNSLKEAQESIVKGNVGDCCRLKQRTAGGYKWRYKDEFSRKV